LFYGPIGEDYGYATLEAFFSQKPVVTCTDSGGILEFVDPETGWIAAPEPRQIATCIESALSQKNAAKARGEAGWARIRGITWDYVFDHLMS